MTSSTEHRDGGDPGTVASMDPNVAVDLTKTTGWAVVGLATGLSTALATGISTVAALWWRRQDRAEADWMAHGANAYWQEGTTPAGNAETQRAWATFRLSNAGDGVAFRVSIVGVDCDIHVTPIGNDELVGRSLVRPGGIRRDDGLVVVMSPGDAVALRVGCEPRFWDRADVLIEWTRSPTWRRRRSRRTHVIHLLDVAPRPTYTGVREGKQVPLREPEGQELLGRRRSRWPRTKAGPRAPQ